MRDLNDPANPYHDQYAAWDRFLFDQARGTTQEQVAAYYDGSAAPGYKLERFGVTKDGFIVPLAESRRQQLEKMRDPQASSDCSFSLPAGGVMDPAQYAEMDQALCAVEASYIPAVPKWLADTPPAAAMFMPGGEVVTLGALGSAGDQAAVPAGYLYDSRGLPFYRFSAKGEQLAATTPGQEWWRLYMPDFDARLKEKGLANCITMEFNGYVMVRDTSAYEIKAIYNYDGTELPLNTPFFDARGNELRWLEGSELLGLYKAQQGG